MARAPTAAFLLAAWSCAAHPAPPAAQRTPAAPDPAWERLCPAPGASVPVPLRAPGDGVKFEPSGAAVWDGRVALASDKQVDLWWWRPGSPEVVADPSWRVPAAPAPADSCCAATPAGWGDALKRQKAGETCAAHGVAPGQPLPWLKVEGLSSTPAGLWAQPNMGFACAENNAVVHLLGPGRPALPVPSLDRAHVLAALGVEDVRVEGLALTPDGRTALLAVRMSGTLARVEPVRRVVVAPVGTDGAVRVADLQAPAAPGLPAEHLGLSDVAVLPGGRVAFTVSREVTVDGKDQVAGEVWLTAQAQPWQRTAGPWETLRVATFLDHKPEAVVALGPRCLAVLFDDDDKYKAAQRQAGGGPEWDSASAFVSYVGLP